jgi:hypothetical protein
VSVLLTILYPHSLAGKMPALAAYALTAGFFSYKSYKALNAPVVKGKRRKPVEVTTEVTGPGQKSNETVTILTIDETPPSTAGEERPPERSPTDTDAEDDARGRQG